MKLLLTVACAVILISACEQATVSVTPAHPTTIVKASETEDPRNLNGWRVLPWGANQQEAELQLKASGVTVEERITDDAGDPVWILAGQEFRG